MHAFSSTLPQFLPTPIPVICPSNKYSSLSSGSLPFSVLTFKFVFMGAFDYVSNFCTVTSIRCRSKGRRALQTVEVKVLMDCDGCERRVKEAICSLKGVISAEVRRNENRVRVTGYVDRNKVLRAVKSTGKEAEFWPYVPYGLVYYPYAPQAYDIMAPAGFVRNVPQAMVVPGSLEEKYSSLFSDENPNSCCIM